MSVRGYFWIFAVWVALAFWALCLHYIGTAF